ncbi:nucleotidyltransferase family protein [Thermodesulfobacteriota bacterium]
MLRYIMDRTTERESSFLFTLARVELDANNERTVERILSKGVDWHKLITIARQNEVELLLYHHLKNTLSTGIVPAELMSSLEKGYYANAHRNMLLFEALGKVLSAMRKSAIDAIVMKGGALLDTIYRGLPLRKMADVDLFVSEGNDRIKAREILSGMGYDYHAAEGAYRVGGDSRFMIELHTKPMAHHLHFFVHEDDRLKKRAEKTRIAGAETLVFRPEDFVLHLCIHATYRHFFKLKFFVDIAECLRAFKDRFRWEELVFWDSRYPVGNYTCTALTLCRRFLGAPVPDWVLNEVRKQSPGILIRPLDAFEPSRLLASVVRQNLQSGILYLLATKTSFTRSNYIKEVLFPSRRKMANLCGLPSSSRKIDLFYLTRPIQLILKNSLPAIRFFTHT